MENKTKLPSLNYRILKKLVIIAIIAIGIVSAALPYILYKRDIETAHNQAREKAILIKTGLLSVMMQTGDPAAVRKAVDEFKKNRNFKLRMIRSDFVRRQYGERDGETSSDAVDMDILSGKLDHYTNLKAVTYIYKFPFIADERCVKCHRTQNDEPVPHGTVLGLLEITFDISDSRAASIKLIIFSIIANLFTVIILFIVFYWILAKDILTPIKLITDSIKDLEDEKFGISLPSPKTREIAVLSERVKHTAETMEKKKWDRERELETDRKKLSQIRDFARKQADHLEIHDENDISDIISRLSVAVKEVEKSQMLTHITEFVTFERKEVLLSNNIELIRPTSLYLTGLITGKQGAVKKGSVELALEEAITNAMVHGNLEVPSHLKEDDFSKFDELVSQRQNEAPYRNRKVKVYYDYSNQKAVFRIIDEGKGFEHKSYINKMAEDSFLPHGRGIIIIRTFASSIQYNESGSELTITFDL
ncbi:MAG: ATP-binding protein [Nitrospinae bacterium]|nr:ATP-binding protein [Nitrospinota bacterium]